MTSIARFIDHTLLKPEATRTEVEALIDEGLRLGAYSVCVNPSYLPLAIPDGLKLAVVCGFPDGKHSTAIKTAEAAESVALGADEVDMVIDIGLAREGSFDLVQAEIASVRAVVPGVLKVIIESAALNDEQIVAVCRAAKAAGADFVKTSTGYHPAGGATVEAVRLMKQTVGDALEVKASGGIRSYATALAMIEAGATRLGSSSTAQIVAEEAGAAPASAGPGY